MARWVTAWRSLAQPAVCTFCTALGTALCTAALCIAFCRAQPYLDQLEEEEDFMAVDDMLLTIAEAPDSSLLGAWAGGSVGGWMDG